ncbi:MAG TPA: glucan biosynthesis protein, partial [Steroidobacteraceae bacterium]|nr:glucan biosynthesis protein [Steroidobacteraceae bacterium]
MQGTSAKSFAALALLLALSPPASSAIAARRARPGGFSYDSVIALARRLAARPYEPPPERVPGWLANLGAGQYRGIQFNARADVWRRATVGFRLAPLLAGFNFRTAVDVSIVDDGRVRAVVATPAMFRFPRVPPPIRPDSALPLSGFQLQAHLTSRRRWDDFLEFHGACYFRAIARGQVFGLSARGLAINTAAPSGEEFPTFTRFWIERPAPRARSIIVYALLESRSTTGAYRFVVTPGIETAMNVDVTLFPRAMIRMYGIAPLNSMFLFDASDRGLRDDYRVAVADSDGLQITTNVGEHVWRPLANPAKLQVSSFTTEAPRGFGLIQRARRLADFEDLEAHYELRPSAWVVPEHGFGRGAVELVEIHASRATNDNVVAFFRPDAPLQPGRSAQFAYRLIWLAQPPLPNGFGEIAATRSGASPDGRER